MKTLSGSLATLAALLLLSTPSQVSASPITLVVNSGSGSVVLPFTGQLTSATLTLDAGNAASLPLGAFTVEINGIDLGYSVRSSASAWSFTLTNPMLAAANQLGAVDVRFDFGGSYNALTLNSLSLDGQVNLAAVPEPGTLVLLGIGLVGIATAVRRRRSA